MKKNKWPKRILILVLILALVGGSVAGVRYWQASHSAVIHVFSVMELAETDYWEDDNESYGTVTADRVQNVYLSSSQRVDQVKVTEGQGVKKGDVLMTYDTTLSQLELDRKMLEIQKLQEDMKNLQSDLAKVKTYRPGVAVAEKDQVEVEDYEPDLDSGGTDDMDDEEDDTLRALPAEYGNYLTSVLLSRGTYGLEQAVMKAAGDRISVILADGESRPESVYAVGSGQEESSELSGEENVESEEESSAEEESSEESSSGEEEESSSEGESSSEESSQADDETESSADDETESSGEEESSTEESSSETETSQEETTSEEETTTEAFPPEQIVEDADGSKDKPYTYHWNKNCIFSQDFLEYLARSRDKAYVLLLTPKDSEKAGEDGAASLLILVRRSEKSDEENAAKVASAVESVRESSREEAGKTTAASEDESKETTAEEYVFELIEMTISRHAYDWQSDTEKPEETSTEETTEEETTEEETDETEESTAEETTEDSSDTTAAATTSSAKPTRSSGGNNNGGSSGGGDDGMSVKYTAAEIANMRNSLEANIKDLDLEIREAQLEYEKKKKELENGEVTADYDGVIRTVRDAGEAQGSNQPLIELSGGGGFYVQGSVSELELESVAIGQNVTVQSFNTGDTYEGEVVEISSFPASDNGFYYYGIGNSNVSYYPFRVQVDESAGLTDGEFVQLMYESADVDEDTFYLLNSMLRSENGKYYVYVRDRNGLLRKQTVKTGKVIWGQYTEILQGLSLDDYVAFPYGKDVKEGCQTEEAETDELWAYE